MLDIARDMKIKQLEIIYRVEQSTNSHLGILLIIEALLILIIEIISFSNLFPIDQIFRNMHSQHIFKDIYGRSILHIQTHQIAIISRILLVFLSHFGIRPLHSHCFIKFTQYGCSADHSEASVQSQHYLIRYSLISLRKIVFTFFIFHISHKHHNNRHKVYFTRQFGSINILGLQGRWT